MEMNTRIWDTVSEEVMTDFQGAISSCWENYHFHKRCYVYGMQLNLE